MRQQPHMIPRRTPRARGNALFMILIAVALFAALSYAITRSGGGASGSIQNETMILDAARLVQSVAGVQAAVDRMLLTGTPEASIQLVSGTNTTPCTTGADCVFATGGGGATWPAFPSSLKKSGSAAIFATDPIIGDSFKAQDVGTTAGDTMILFFDLTDKACTEINRNLGISGIPVSAAGTTLTGASGKFSACVYYRLVFTWYNTYYHVLVSR